MGVRIAAIPRQAADTCRASVSASHRLHFQEDMMYPRRRLPSWVGCQEMRFPFTKKKSAGVVVAPAVYRPITRGNEARDRKDWPEAIKAYREALRHRPDLAHIWIQLGHAAKEGGLEEDAKCAYLRAVELTPENGDVPVHLGHLAKRAGNMPDAARHFLRAFQMDPSNTDAASELQQLVALSTGFTKMSVTGLLREHIEGNPNETLQLDDMLHKARYALNEVCAALGDAAGLAPLRNAATLLAEIERKAAANQGMSNGEDGLALVFDISDLVGYVAHARLPTGIQRVQLEAITRALDTQGLARVCCFLEWRNAWVEVPVCHFRHLAQLSVSGGGCGDPEWLAVLNRLHLALAIAAPFRFPRGACLVNLGTSWLIQNYFLHVRNAKAECGIRYIPFIHDFIPIMTPEHVVKELAQDFVAWVVGVFAHADHYLVNSESTKGDLLKVAKILGAEVDPDNVAVIPLDADCRKLTARKLGRGELGRWKLDGRPFVLMVGTVESRKGHTVALDAWTELIQQYGASKIPKLVLAGRSGWLNDAVYQRLAHDERLAKQVTMISGASDEELALLYRSCLFTIYPSFYEGWGLPVTESLCYGKPVITCGTSSLPEAGGGFAIYIEPGSSAQLAEASERLILDPVHRQETAARISAKFRPRTWQDVAHQISTAIMRLARRSGAVGTLPLVPLATLGAYHPLGRNRASQIWPGIGSGEAFRVGTGWLPPEPWGCWTHPEGGEVAIALPGEGSCACACI